SGNELEDDQSLAEIKPPPGIPQLSLQREIGIVGYGGALIKVWVYFFTLTLTLTPGYSLLATTRFAKSPAEPFPTQRPILRVVRSFSFSTTRLGLEAPLTKTDIERSATSMRA